MSERGKGLAIFTLLIGICGMGLGIYAIFFQPQQSSEPSVITNIWTVEQVGSYSPGDSYADMPNMNATITVNTGETVYVTFNALFTISTGASGTWYNGGVWVWIDGASISDSQRLFSGQTSTVSTIWVTLTTQFLITNLEAGTHELKVQVKASSGAGSKSISSGLFLVYTYQ